MAFDGKGPVCFRVSRAQSGQWDVYEEGFDKALASFQDREDASRYANKLASAKEGAIVLIQNGTMSS